jgi:hypothetical protein
VQVVNPKDYEAFSFALLGMALMGGAVSKGNWMGVSSTLNGALKGYLEGNQARAQKEYDDFDRQFKAAKDHDAAALKSYDDILNNKRLSINDQLNQIRTRAKIQGDEDVATAAQMKHFDAMLNQINARRRSLDQTVARFDTVGAQIQAQRDKAAAARSATGGANLNEDGKWFVESTMAGGNDKYAKMLQSRYGGQIAAGILNDMGKTFRTDGLDPRSMTEAQINLQVQKSTQTQITNRINGVERLTSAIKPLETRLQDLVRQVNGNGTMTMNQLENKVKSELGNEKLAELHTLMGSVGRQYIEAITMPGSNAQLHATSQDWADGTFSPNMPISALNGTLKAMNLEINSTSQALRDQLGKSHSEVTSQGPSIAPPGGARAAAHGQPSIDDLVKKYAR